MAELPVSAIPEATKLLATDGDIIDRSMDGIHGAVKFCWTGYCNEMARKNSWCLSQHGDSVWERADFPLPTAAARIPVRSLGLFVVGVCGLWVCVRVWVRVYVYVYVYLYVYVYVHVYPLLFLQNWFRHIWLRQNRYPLALFLTLCIVI